MPLLLSVRFLAEMGMLVCLAWGGWLLGPDGAMQLALALLLPAAAVLVWGQLVAPKAPRRLEDPRRLWIEVTLFTSALMAVALTQHRPAVLVGVLAWTGFLVSMPARGQEPVPPRS